MNYIILGMFILLTTFVIGVFSYRAYSLSHSFKKIKYSNCADLEFPWNDTYIYTSDKKKIFVKTIYPISSSTVKGIFVICHNMGASHQKYLKQAKFLCSSGFITILLDFRMHGLSEMDYSLRAIYKIDRDLETLLEKILITEELQNLNIYIWGFSLGTYPALKVGSRYNQVKGIIVDSGPSLNLGKDFSLAYKRVNWPFFNNKLGKALGYMTMRIIFFKSCFFSEEELRIIRKKPVMYIHGKKDTFIEYFDTLRIYKQSDSVKSVYWLIENSRHLTNYLLYEEEYQKKLIEFITST
jgi:pimeloyl-ACP methyl ester carboxylesterase